MANKIYAILGFSGSGKDTTVKNLLNKHDDLQNLVSYTTRPMRVGEQDGREYYFIDNAEFNAMYEHGQFLEIREYHVANGDDWYYGFTTGEVEEKLRRGNVVVVIDLQGYIEFKEVYKEQCVGMFLNVNKDILINRIIGREQLTWDVVSEAVRRLNSDTERFENVQDYVDYIIDTDDSEYTLQVVEDIIYNKQ